jgi:ABC-type uncharacterized transport system ATPase subunit
MVIYAIYYFEEIEKAHFIGFLPERRKTFERITQESILNYLRTILNYDANDNKFFFIQLTLDERMGEILWPKPSLSTPA